MTIEEQIEEMKQETRIANRWSDSARASSLAKRQASGSVWGWNHRQRADEMPSVLERSQAALESAASEVAAKRAVHAGTDTYEKRQKRMTKQQVAEAILQGKPFDAASLYK